MIKIKKGSNEFIVSKKAYEDTFKKLGYHIIGNNEVGVVQSTIPTDNTIEDNLIKEEEENNKDKNDNNDVVTSKDLKNSIGIEIKEDFGFENKQEDEKENSKNNLYEEKLNALKKENNPKLGK